MKWIIVVPFFLSCLASARDLQISTENGWRALSGKEAEAYRTTRSYLQARLKEIETLRIGSSYADLSRHFKRDGGISAAYRHRFVMILCPMIKVDVEFEEKGVKVKWPIRPTAKITKISRPYLEPEFLD